MQYKVININDAKCVSEIDSISRSLAKIITSDFNDQVTILINGNRGSGKSYFGLGLALKTAQEVARLKGGSISKYFSLKNTAIIRLDNVLNLLENLTQYGIYFLDDIGVGYSNREWRSDKNIRMNKIIQTFRTDNVCTILSVPDKNLIDKVPREMIDKYVETNKEFNMYKLGLNFVKLFNIERLLRDEKILEILPLISEYNSQSRYVRYVARKPPIDITNEYDILRKKIAQELRIEEAQAIKNGDAAQKEKAEKKTKVTKKELAKEFIRDYQSGVYGSDISMRAALKEYNKKTDAIIPYEAVIRYRNI